MNLAEDTLPNTAVIEGPVSVSGTTTPPGDKSISHRALILSALADGESVISDLADGDDVEHTARALTAFGAELTRDGNTIRVVGGALHEPAGVVYTGNSGTGIRLLAGVAAGLPALTVLHGDASVNRRPMDRVVVPLRQMGAAIDARANGRFPPLTVRGTRLRAMSYDMPVPSAQVKSAILLAGLTADGETVVREQLLSRSHTEEMLLARGADIHTSGTTVRLRPSRLKALDERVPVDPSQAAFWIVAGALGEANNMTIENVYLGPARRGFLDVLLRMGAQVSVEEPTSTESGCTIRVLGAELHGVTIEPDEIPGLIDEIPILAVAAALASGTTVIRGATELRFKESDRISSTARMLAAFGVGVTEFDDGLSITGGTELIGAEVDSGGDHRIAMAATIAGLFARGRTTIRGMQAVGTSYPGFLDDLNRCAPQALVAESEHGDQS
ncbi:MAG: aroA [Marmoricola sp.]|nr:aroA [Marmoricola sp.]